MRAMIRSPLMNTQLELRTKEWIVEVSAPEPCRDIAGGHPIENQWLHPERNFAQASLPPSPALLPELRCADLFALSPKSPACQSFSYEHQEEVSRESGSNEGIGQRQG